MRILFASIVATILLSPACDSSDGGPVELGSSFECLERADDATGYLQPICSYIVANRESYPDDPNALEITEIISGDGWQDAASPFANAEYDYVGLSCCFTGDWAVINKSTREVVELILGDV